MSSKKPSFAEQRRAERVRETRLIREEQGRRARAHYTSVKNSSQGSPWHRNKHNRADGS